MYPVENIWSYIIISPVKDEETFITDTIESVIKQTVVPIKWIIVDDGSRDKTPDIIKEYSKNYPWIEYMRIERDAERRLGVAEAMAFNTGYETVKDLEFDFIVKLDGDIRFGSDYFEQLFLSFDNNKKLGIASGAYLENSLGVWEIMDMPSYHAAGASKVIRRNCFKEIGGFITRRGWDTVDEIRAQMLGWETCHFKNLLFYHLRGEGSAAGSIKTGAMHGEIYYLLGGGILFLIFKVIHRMFTGKPFIIGGFMMLFGFMKSLLSGQTRSVNAQEAAYYRDQLNRRIWNTVKGLFAMKRQKTEGGC